MQEANCITIISNRKKVVISINTILYVLMTGKNAEIHVSGGRIYKTKMKLSEYEEKLGDGFLKAHRGCPVAAMAIHDITDRINLSNGEFLIYTLRKKNEMMNQFRATQKASSTASLRRAFLLRRRNTAGITAVLNIFRLPLR